MILVDTSVWIESFRGREPWMSRLREYIEAGDVALCGPILTELGRGFASPVERKRTLPLLNACHVLRQPERLWEEAGELGYLLRRKGNISKTLDLLIATYALAHRVPIFTRDGDFRTMQRRGIPLDLV